jgi:hypothetical protein
MINAEANEFVKHDITLFMQYETRQKKGLLQTARFFTNLETLQACSNKSC